MDNVNKISPLSDKIINKINTIGIKRFLIFLVILAIVIIVIVFINRRIKRNRNIVRGIIHDDRTLNLWKDAPISTLGMYKTTNDIMYPEEDNVINYSMHINIYKWSNSSGTTLTDRELFHHGNSNNCCKLSDDDIISVNYDNNINNLKINVLTNRECNLNMHEKSIKSLSVGKNEIYGIFSESENESESESKIYFKKNYENGKRGDECWDNIDISSDLIPGDELKEIRVIDIKYSKTNDTIVFVLVKHVTDSYNSTYKLMKLNKVDEEYGLIVLKEELDVYVNEQSSNNSSNLLEVVSIDEKTIYIFYKNSSSKYLIYNIENAKIEESEAATDNTWTPKTENDFTIDGELPKDSEDYLWILSNGGGGDKTIYKCKKPCNDQKFETDTSDINFKSISLDSENIWGISGNEDNNNRIFSKRLKGENSNWINPNMNYIDSGKGVDVINIYTSNMRDNSQQLWGIASNNRITKTHKCNPYFSESCKIRENEIFEDLVEVENIPIGRDFHLMITLTKKRVDVYIDGKLVKTKVLVGERPAEGTGKRIRFFGSSSKVDGIVSRFRYMPFHVNMYSLRKLSEYDLKEGKSK